MWRYVRSVFMIYLLCFVSMLCYLCAAVFIKYTIMFIKNTNKSFAILNFAKFGFPSDV